MLLSVTTKGVGARDLGFLLAKHPDRVAAFDLAQGKATVFWREAAMPTQGHTHTQATCCMVVEIDPIDLARPRHSEDKTRHLEDYVNDRPYVAGSLMSTAIAQVFGSALNGKAPPEYTALASTLLPLVLTISAIRCQRGPEMLEKLFAPLGWQVSAESQDLDLAFPSWGPGYYYTVTLTGAARLQDALRQLYVLLPVLDGGKHYALSDAEADKLARLGAGWLEAHPERDYIAARFLRHRKGLIEQALSALQESVEPDPLGAEEPAKQPLGRLRYETIVTTVKDSGAKSVLDLGCGEGKLLFELAKHPFERLVGADASLFQLRRARWLTKRDKRIQLLQSCLTYQDSRLRDYDAAILCEVIEHINPERLPALEASIFGFAHPKLVIVTTPNREYNVLYEKLDGKLRHKDHRFEWTRSEFESWAKSVANKHDYEVTFQGIGEADATRGAPTQMAVFHA